MSTLPESIRAAEILASIRSELPEYRLVPGSSPVRSVPETLRGLSAEELLGANVIDSDMANCVRSGLLLRADLLDASHTLSQDIPTTDGSYWHGIMHRREPDYPNSGYWFRRVGDHPVFEDLTAGALDVASADTVSEITSGGAWDSFRFIDLCEACQRGRRSDLQSDLLALQELEIDLLLAYCYRGATSS